MPSPPSPTSCQSSAGEEMPPGYRQAMPTIAIGSWRLARSSASSIVTFRRYSRSFCSSATTRPHLRIDEVEQLLVGCLHEPIGCISRPATGLIELGGQGTQASCQLSSLVFIGETRERLLELPHLRRQGRAPSLHAVHLLQEVSGERGGGRVVEDD